jgi:hypothetical protein
MRRSLIFRIRYEGPQSSERPYDVVMDERYGPAFLQMLHLPALPSFEFAPEQLVPLHSAIADLIQYDGDLDTIANKHYHEYNPAKGNAEHYLRLLRDLSRLASYAQRHGGALEWEHS